MAQSNELERVIVTKKFGDLKRCFFFNHPDYTKVMIDVMRDLLTKNSSVIKLMYLSDICTGPDNGKTRHD